MAQRSRYWSCSKFANWLRGTKKPGAQTGEGWRKWNKQAREAHPIRYWLAEEGLDMIQNVLWWPVDKLYDVKYYINNRWVSRTHALTSRSLERGKWHEFETRMIHCLFDEMVDYIEIEEAWSHIAWDEEARTKYEPPFYAWGWFRWRTWRCPQAGIDKLKWAASITNEEWLDEDQKHLAEPTHQAKTARELLELYHWWKNVRPFRPDPMDASGWTAWCERRRQKINEQDPEAGALSFLGSDNETPDEQSETRRILDLSYKIEQEQEQEDTDMMIRLIKIRRGMWT